MFSVILEDCVQWRKLISTYLQSVNFEWIDNFSNGTYRNIIAYLSGKNYYSIVSRMRIVRVEPVEEMNIEHESKKLVILIETVPNFERIFQMLLIKI